MQDTSTNNKRIAKNTFFLYIRMLLKIFVGLYTSRVIFKVLGITDFGIYNVVGGVVYMLEFLNSGMTMSSQRFLSFELGKKDYKRLELVFSTSIIIHFILAFFVFLIIESIGLWILNTKLNIPESRLYAANWVLQCSVLSFIISIISVPYNSCIIAHEKMNFYAYISILEVILKLIIALCLQFFKMDYLILYAVLLLVLQLTIRFIYVYFCKKMFLECKAKLKFNLMLFKKMFSYASWNMMGCLGMSFKDQWTNIILNIYFGTAINSARGIAGQVNGIINGFATNFSMALNPQIIKQYASGNLRESMTIVYTGSRFVCFLLALFVIPFLMNVDFILFIWLGDVPRYTNIFIYIILINSLLNSMSHSVMTGIHATGNVKLFQTLWSLTLLLEIPCAYVIIMLGGNSYQAVLPSVIFMFFTLIISILILKKNVPSYSINEYIFSCVFRCIIIIIISYYLSGILTSLITCEGITKLIASSIISFLTTALVVWLFGLKKQERSMVIEKVKSYLY